MEILNKKFIYYMSSGGMTNFLRDPNGIDLSGFFPAYEVLKHTINMANNSPNRFDFSLTLTRNRNNVTNYIVLAQPIIISSNFSSASLSNLVRSPGIFNKTSTTFSATISIQTTSPSLTVEADIMFVVVYPFSSIQSIISSLNYSDNAGNPINFFPQYMTSSIGIPSTSSEISLSIDLSSKSTSRTDYTYFGSFYDNSSSSGINATTMQQIYYYTVSQSSTSTGIRILNQDRVSNVNVETLILYPLTISTNNYTSNYNVMIGSQTYSLSKLFPLCEFFSQDFSNESSSYDRTWDLSYNYTGTSNFVVLTSFVYNSAGNGSTYNPWQAIGGAGNITVTKTSTSFRTVFSKGTGDIWNGGIRCLVIYY
jgi:hypothetical protein